MPKQDTTICTHPRNYTQPKISLNPFIQFQDGLRNEKKIDSFSICIILFHYVVCCTKNIVFMCLYLVPFMCQVKHYKKLVY